jgi:hypothetical protein
MGVYFAAVQAAATRPITRPYTRPLGWPALILYRRRDISGALRANGAVQESKMHWFGDTIYGGIQRREARKVVIMTGKYTGILKLHQTADQGGCLS